MRRLLHSHVAVLLLAPSLLLGQTWDRAPLRSRTPTPSDGLPPTRPEFFQWLRANTPQGEQLQLARERIYTYVSEIAKSDSGTFPPHGDSTAVFLFLSAARLGVAGSDQIVAALDPKTAVQPVPVPSGLTLSLQPPIFAMGSDDSTWTVCFPYYFMPGPVGRQTPSNGVTTEIATLSTLAAPDSGKAGSSQATILIAASPLADSLSHVQLWIHQLGVAPVPPPTPGATGQWFHSPPGESMEREAVVRTLPQRVILVAYIGLPGTYESNRPHFIDLLRTLAPRRCAA